MFGLIDCDNFFVSCERVVDPTLDGKPVVVLSNNDGCVVARSNEVKRMGVPMGIPFFKIKNLVASEGIIVRSGNHQLYGELSRQLMHFIAENTKDQEVYSIDECFVSLTGVAQPVDFMRMLRGAIWDTFHLPVSIGIADTKTLAKAASHFAKHISGYRGVAMIDTDVKRQKALALLPIGEVWGIGRQFQKKLSSMGCQYASDFVALDQHLVSQVFSKTGLATYLELKGVCCHAIEKRQPPQSIFSSRSLPSEINDFSQLRELVVTFAAHCHRKLRNANGKCAKVSLQLATNRFKTTLPQQQGLFEVQLLSPTDDIIQITSCATQLLKENIRSECLYKKVGVGLSQLSYTPTSVNIFDTHNREKSERLNSALDDICKTFGQSTVTLASQNGRTLENISRADQRSDIPSERFPDIDKTSYPPTRFS